MALTFLSPIHKAMRQIGIHLEGSMAALGLSNPEAHLLAFLRSYEPASVGHLRRVFGHKRSTLTSLLNRLEQRGLLRRELHPDDRRSYLVRLTDAGRDVAARAEAPVHALEAAIRERVDERALEGFRTVLAALEDATAVTLAAKET